MGYKDDMQNGMKQRWYENGEPWTYVRFENNKMVGELKQWYRNGKLGCQIRYSPLDMPWLTFDSCSFKPLANQKLILPL